MKIPKHYQKVRDVKITPKELIAFEDKVKDAYETAQVKGPIHLSKNNEEQLKNYKKCKKKKIDIKIIWLFLIGIHFLILLYGIHDIQPYIYLMVYLKMDILIMIYLNYIFYMS
jgi:hypothetical protein